MDFAEQKVELFKIVADADEVLVDAMLKKILEYYSANPDVIPEGLLKVLAGSSQDKFDTEGKLYAWEEVKQRIESELKKDD